MARARTRCRTAAKQCIACKTARGGGGVMAASFKNDLAPGCVGLEREKGVREAEEERAVREQKTRLDPKNAHAPARAQERKLLNILLPPKTLADYPA